MAGLAKAQVGDLIGPSTGQLTTVTKIEPIRVYFSVSQQLMTQMQERRLAEGKATIRTSREGPQLELVLASGTVYPIKGRVRFANNQVDVKTGTITVVGEFPNPQMLLVPGMFVRVRALLDTEKNALLVPQRAVTDMQGRYLIAVVGADNKVSIRPVTAGERCRPGLGDQGRRQSRRPRGGRRHPESARRAVVVNPVPFAFEKPITSDEARRRADEGCRSRSRSPGVYAPAHSQGSSRHASAFSEPWPNSSSTAPSSRWSFPS